MRLIAEIVLLSLKEVDQLKFCPLPASCKEQFLLVHKSNL